MKFYILSFNSFYHSRCCKRKLLTCLLISVLINVKVLFCPTKETPRFWLKFCRLLPLVLLLKSRNKMKMSMERMWNDTYLLNPWCRVLLEKLTGLQLVKKFPAFHGTRRFITAPTNVRQLSLSWASPIQSMYPHPTSWRSILILSTHLRLGLPSGLFPSRFPNKTLYTLLSSDIRSLY